MAVLLKNDAVFLHIPKTGGSWVVAVLSELGLVRGKFATKHADMERVLHCRRYYPLRSIEAALRCGPGWQTRVRRAFKFCFVRHPLRWYESYWKFSMQRGWPRWGYRRGRQRWHPNAALNELADPDFNRFIAKVIAHEPGYVTRMFAAYATPEIDFVGRQERLAEDLIEVLARLGVSCDAERIRRWPRVNETPKEIPDPQWDPSLRKQIEELERPALERFGYD